MNRSGLRRSAPPRSASQRLAGSGGLARGTGPARDPKRENASQRAGRAPRRWTTAKGDRCEICGYGAWEVGREGLRLVQHHAIYAQHVEAAGGDVWDPRNSLTVCSGPGGCHEGQHDRSCPIRLADLTDSVYEFARETLGGPAAYEYLARRYAVPDPRLDALLAEA